MPLKIDVKMVFYLINKDPPFVSVFRVRYGLAISEDSDLGFRPSLHGAGEADSVKDFRNVYAPLNCHEYVFINEGI